MAPLCRHRATPPLLAGIAASRQERRRGGRNRGRHVAHSHERAQGVHRYGQRVVWVIFSFETQRVGVSLMLHPRRTNRPLRAGGPPVVDTALAGAFFFPWCRLAVACRPLARTLLMRRPLRSPVEGKQPTQLGPPVEETHRSDLSRSGRIAFGLGSSRKILIFNTQLERLTIFRFNLIDLHRIHKFLQSKEFFPFLIFSFSFHIS